MSCLSDLTIDKTIVIGTAVIIDRPNGFRNGWRVCNDALRCSECGSKAPSHRGFFGILSNVATEWCGACGSLLAERAEMDNSGRSMRWMPRKSGRMSCSACGMIMRSEEAGIYCTSCGAHADGGYNGRNTCGKKR